jgi:Beta protein
MAPRLDTHYYPFLKGKAGELKALASLPRKQRELLTPLLDVPPEDVKFERVGDLKSIQIDTVEEALEGYATKVAKAWGPLDTCLVDFAGFHPDLRLAGGMHPLTAFFVDAKAADLAAIPVTGLERDAAQVRAVRSVCAEWRLGAAIRLRGPALIDPGALAEALTRLLGQIGLAANQVDLLVDFGTLIKSNFGEIAAAAPRIIAALPGLHDWRSLVFCSGAYPFQLGSLVKKNETRELPRRDWQLWRGVISAAPAPLRLPAFGDYGATRADWPSAFDPTEMSISAKIVYATDEDWVIVKGEKLGNDPDQYHALARRLRQHPLFLAAEHCPSEVRIIECSKEIGGPGNSETWVTVATRHHLEVVTRQLANLA